MKRVHLFQRDPVEAQKRARELKNLGYAVSYGPVSPEALRRLKVSPPEAVLIDLGRAPMLGRDVGIFIRRYRATRNIPIVFLEGEAAKVIQIKQHLPDAVYTSWRAIKGALEHAVAHPPAEPVKSKSLLAGYSSTPLVRKLGIKPKSILVLIDTPGNFLKNLGQLPDGVIVKNSASQENGMMIWFVKSRKALESRIAKIAASVKKDGLWIVWPKKKSSVSSDLSQQDVRRIGLAASLVDYKVCAVDKTWSGLKFAKRK